MSLYEIGFCDKDEYIDGKQKRLQQEDIYVGNLYTGLFALLPVDPELKTNPWLEEAFKLNARVESKDPVNKLGLYAIKFVTVNSQLQPIGDADLKFFDGFLTDPTQQEIMACDIVGVEYFANIGYFKEYEGPVHETGEAQESTHADSRVLAAV
jgi:hypothetical protein